MPNVLLKYLSSARVAKSNIVMNPSLMATKTLAFLWKFVLISMEV